MRSKITNTISLMILASMLTGYARGQLTGIHAAARDGDVAKVRTLLDQDPHLVNARENEAWTPLHFAAQGGHKELAELLIARGANINAKLKQGGGTPLHVAATKGHKSIVALLLAKGANANATDDNEWTPLHRAAISGDREIAELLLSHGANVYAWGNSSVTPIDQATENGHLDFANFLRERGRNTLPIADDFSGSCQWPSGETDLYSFGCDHSTYRMQIKRPGPVHMPQNFGWDTPAVSVEVDARVASGPGTELGSSLLGVGCLRDHDTGFVAILKTNGAWGIMRLNKEFTQLAGANEAGTITGLAKMNRLRIVCAHEGEKTTVVSFFVNGRKVGSVKDEPGFARFNGVWLYVDTFPGVVVFERFAARGASGQAQN